MHSIVYGLWVVKGNLMLFGTRQLTLYTTALTGLVWITMFPVPFYTAPHRDRLSFWKPVTVGLFFIILFPDYSEIHQRFHISPQSCIHCRVEIPQTELRPRCDTKNVKTMRFSLQVLHAAKPETGRVQSRCYNRQLGTVMSPTRSDTLKFYIAAKIHISWY